MKVERKKRIFLKDDLVIDSYDDVKPYFDALLDEKIENAATFRNWLHKSSELEAVLEEDMAWRYIQMTIDTTNQQAAKAYETFVNEINPPVSAASNLLNK